MESCAFLDPELAGELEMVSAMYGDQVTISHTESENLHRLDSTESGYFSSPSTTTTTSERQIMMNQHASSEKNDEGHFPSSEDYHTVILLRLRKNVQVELTFPSSGYYVHR